MAKSEERQLTSSFYVHLTVYRNKFLTIKPTDALNFKFYSGK